MPKGKSKSIKSVSKEINKSTDLAVNSIGSLSEGFLKSLMETSNVAELILNSIHNLIYGIGHNISVLSHTIIKNIGLSIESITDTLGEHSRRIPLIGEHTAYLIEKSGSSIKYIIVPIADLVSLTSEITLDSAECLKDVLVFTVHSGQKVSANAVKKAQSAVEKLASVGKKTVSNVVDETIISNVKKSLKKLNIK